MAHSMITLLTMKVIKRTKKRSGEPSRRITATFLFLSAIALLLYLTLSVWPRVSAAEYSRRSGAATATTDSGHTRLSNAARAGATATAESSGHTRPSAAARAGTTATAESSGAATLLPRGGRLAVIIDDAGNDLSLLERFLSFRGPLTIAVLPRLAHSTAAARRAHTAGKEVMLHLPLEPMGNENPGPGALLVSFDLSLIRETLAEDFASVPFARGVNNHMGSRATQDPALMDALFAYLQEQDKYFVDSRTTAATLGKDYAAQYGIRMTERTYFLDNIPERSAITRVLNEGVAHARLKGGAVLIGHVQNQAVIDVLENVYDELTSSGLEFVTVSRYIRMAGSK